MGRSKLEAGKSCCSWVRAGKASARLWCLYWSCLKAFLEGSVSGDAAESHAGGLRAGCARTSPLLAPLPIRASAAQQNKAEPFSVLGSQEVPVPLCLIFLASGGEVGATNSSFMVMEKPFWKSLILSAVMRLIAVREAGGDTLCLKSN